VYMPPPLPRRSAWTYCFAHLIQTYQPSPKGLSGRPAHCPFRGLLSVHSRYRLHTRAVTNSSHANRRLQPLRYLHDCSDCFRLERLPGGTCTHWKAPPCHGAHPKRTCRPLLNSLTDGLTCRWSVIVRRGGSTPTSFVRTRCAEKLLNVRIHQAEADISIKLLTPFV
jgi:hypothetical protein